MTVGQEELLSVTQAHQRKGVSRSAIYQAITGGRLPSVTIGGHYYLRPSDVDAWQPLPPSDRKGLPIGGRKRQEPEPVKRGRGRPRKEVEGTATE